MNPVPVKLAGANAIDMAMPKVTASLQIDARALFQAIPLKKAQLNPFGMDRENCEGRPIFVECGAEWSFRWRH
jgi:hypothetical protein